LFQANSQQVISDIDSFDFASIVGNQDIPYITTNMPLEIIQSSDQDLHVSSKKRSAPEVSQDNEHAGSSSRCYKISRTIVSDESVGSSASSCKSSANRKSNKRIPTGYASSSFIEDDAEYCERMNERPPVDTSAAHIKALTSVKGATMCVDIIKAMKKGKNDDCQELKSISNANMTPEEQKKLHRARNRVHARNTRVRKQAYVDELKRTLIKMLDEREAEEEAKNQAAEERRIRSGVLKEFLALQTNKEPSICRWNAILEDDVTLEVSKIGRDSPKRYCGAHEIMKKSQDANQLFGDGSFSLRCHQDSFLMEGTNAVMDWTVASADQKIRGTCRVSFNPLSNKLSSVAINSM
jgi:hypothetical protein